MIAAYIISAVVVAGAMMLSGSDWLRKILGWGFYIVQGCFGIWILTGNLDATDLGFFTYDRTGTLFFVLMSVIAPMVYRYSLWYLDYESAKEKKIYHALLVMLCMSMACVYFSNNIAVNWIFLEATTLCTAGLIYHRRSARALEATWKYIFVCSVGITMAYLGILLIGGMADGDLSYKALATAVQSGNPLFLKIAFLFMMVGYSCKVEIFPLYTIGVDANMAAPAPASALISTGLVNAGFVSILRVYRLMEGTGIAGWAAGVLMVAGLISLLIGAIFMRRTNHFKRFLSYSTVENMGIAAIALGLGGAGIFAAIFHVAGHSVLKSGMFLQISQVGKAYGHYQIKRTGDYINVNQPGAIALMLFAVMMLGFPPSPLFISELMIFRQMAAEGDWWLLAGVVIVLCIVMYNFGRNIIKLCFNPVKRLPEPRRIVWSLAVPVLVLAAAALIMGIIQPAWLVEWVLAVSGNN